MTQKLNYIISRFAFHEMRMHANAVLADQIKAYIDHPRHKFTIEDIEEPGDQQSASSRKILQASAARLRARIDHLEAEQRALLLEISCNSKIASSQLQIVSVIDVHCELRWLTIPLRFTILLLNVITRTTCKWLRYQHE
jgi:hypothetical protein